MVGRLCISALGELNSRELVEEPHHILDYLNELNCHIMP